MSWVDLGIFQFCFILFFTEFVFEQRNLFKTQVCRKERALVVDNAPSLPEEWGHKNNFSTTRRYLLW